MDGAKGGATNLKVAGSMQWKVEGGVNTVKTLKFAKGWDTWPPPPAPSSYGGAAPNYTLDYILESTTHYTIAVNACLHQLCTVYTLYSAFPFLNSHRWRNDNDMKRKNIIMFVS